LDNLMSFLSRLLFPSYLHVTPSKQALQSFIVI
jgi:hypothetical protein